MPFLPDVFGYDEMPSSASRSRMSTATPQHSLRPAGAPGSRSTTIRSGSHPIRHCGVCSSSAARFATQTSVANSSTTTKSMVSRDFVEPGTGRRARRTQSGVPPGAFFSKKCAPSTPFGYRIRVSARSFRCGSSTGASRV
jgi:hypothetical protein